MQQATGNRAPWAAALFLPVGITSWINYLLFCKQRRLRHLTHHYQDLSVAWQSILQVERDLLWGLNVSLSLLNTSYYQSEWSQRKSWRLTTLPQSVCLQGINVASDASVCVPCLSALQRLVSRSHWLIILKLVESDFFIFIVFHEPFPSYQPNSNPPVLAGWATVTFTHSSASQQPHLVFP